MQRNATFKDTLQLARYNKHGRKFPQPGDARCVDGLAFPVLYPKFRLPFNERMTLFAIGSCFARNIEDALASTGVRLPTLDYDGEEDGRSGRLRGIMNEFTPGCISQRIISALENRELSKDTIIPDNDGFADLLLVNRNAVSFERAHERRAQIDAVYKNLAVSHLAVITLGYVESWYDQETKLFLNRKPPKTAATLRSERYVFKRLDVDECMKLLQPAFDALVDRGLKIIVTVSPVPLAATFSGEDCVIANAYSKSVLRVCATHLSRHPHVDYFPSYEIVCSGGAQARLPDNIHVTDEVVRQVTKYMVDCYSDSQLSGAERAL